MPGLPELLWSFFKTAEFWRGDLLLTPVLVLDQFEELFTLQSEQARAHFLDQLSYLTRGVRPPSATPSAEELSEHAPAVRIVLSLREDYLGFLEEAAEHIPQILDARFRLAPLDLHAAEEAIVGPAAVRDPGLETRPFALDRQAVTSILDYLSQRRTRTVGETRRYVEPFQLQLVCRRIEQIAAARQAASGSDLTITMADLGGEAGLTRTLRDFYREAIRTLPDRHRRRASRRLCEEYLISPEGRRLSLEENELRRQLDLPKETLSQLVASRLLRSENRSESTYYELSHDALVEPIFASRRTKARVMGAFGIGSGALLFLLSLFAVLAMQYYMLTEYVFATETSEFVGEVIGLFLVMLGGLGIVVSSAILLRGSARSILRYRRARGPGLAGAETRPRTGFVSGLPALIGWRDRVVAGPAAAVLCGRDDARAAQPVCALGRAAARSHALCGSTDRQRDRPRYHRVLRRLGGAARGGRPPLPMGRVSTGRHRGAPRARSHGHHARESHAVRGLQTAPWRGCAPRRAYCFLASAS